MSLLHNFKKEINHCSTSSLEGKVYSSKKEFDSQEDLKVSAEGRQIKDVLIELIKNYLNN